jgi:outer membrane protein
MKNLSLILNLVLLAALGYLYYYTFKAPSLKKDSNAVTAVKSNDSTAAGSKVAYVDLDSLNEKITFFKQSRTQLEQKQKSNEADLENAIKGLENKKNAFFQKNPKATPEEVEELRMQLMQDQQQIEGRRQRYINDLNQENFKLVERIRAELKKFLVKYNKEKKYQYILTTSESADIFILKDSTLNITSDVIKGLNAELKTAVK